MVYLAREFLLFDISTGSLDRVESQYVQICLQVAGLTVDVIRQDCGKLFV